MALLLYFLGNFQQSLTAHGTTETLQKELERVAALPEEKRWATFKSFDPEDGGNNAVKITIMNPAITLSHVIEEDDKELTARMEEQKRILQLKKAQANTGLVDFPPRGH